ncbi:MAG: response regulator [Terriglobales bacterium]
MPADKILVVDDERLVRWSLRQKCEEWGYQVIEAEAGEPGLKLVQHDLLSPGHYRHLHPVAARA